MIETESGLYLPKSPDAERDERRQVLRERAQWAFDTVSDIVCDAAGQSELSDVVIVSLVPVTAAMVTELMRQDASQ